MHIPSAAHSTGKMIIFDNKMNGGVAERSYNKVKKKKNHQDLSKNFESRSANLPTYLPTLKIFLKQQTKHTHTHIRPVPSLLLVSFVWLIITLLLLLLSLHSFSRFCFCFYRQQQIRILIKYY